MLNRQEMPSPDEDNIESKELKYNTISEMIEGMKGFIKHYPRGQYPVLLPWIPFYLKFPQEEDSPAVENGVLKTGIHIIILGEKPEDGRTAFIYCRDGKTGWGAKQPSDAGKFGHAVFWDGSRLREGHHIDKILDVIDAVRELQDRIQNQKFQKRFHEWLDQIPPNLRDHLKSDFSDEGMVRRQAAEELALIEAPVFVHEQGHRSENADEDTLKIILESTSIGSLSNMGKEYHLKEKNKAARGKLYRS